MTDRQPDWKANSMTGSIKCGCLSLVIIIIIILITGADISKPKSKLIRGNTLDQRAVDMRACTYRACADMVLVCFQIHIDLIYKL